VSGLLIALPCLAASALIVKWLAWYCRKPTFRELSRFTTNDDARDAYKARMEALGHAPVRNVRIKETA
jgi:hypothetical protein